MGNSSALELVIPKGRVTVVATPYPAALVVKPIQTCPDPTGVGGWSKRN